MLQEQVQTVLAGPNGPVPPALEPLTRALASMPRANSGVTWLRSPAVQQLLRALASGTIALTHHDLDALPGSRTIEYIRGLLIEQGVLPRRDRRVADFERWLQQRLASIEPDDHRRVLERYGRWHHLRRLRTQSATAPVSEAAFERAKQCVTVAGQFLRWLSAADLPLDQVRQAHLDQWYSEGNSTAAHASRFLSWARQQRLLPPELTVPRRRSDNAPPALGEQQRLTALRRVLLVDDTALHVRVLAGLVLLFAQPVNRLTQLTVHDVDVTGDVVRLRFAREWLEVPEPFAALLTAHLTQRPNRQTAANPSSDWLFPGVIPGEPVKAATVSAMLSHVGVPALPTRAAAWRELTRQAPPAVLAHLLGASPATVTRHAELAGADYARYAATRTQRGHS